MTKTYSQPKLMKVLAVTGLSFFNFLLVIYFNSVLDFILVTSSAQENELFIRIFYYMSGILFGVGVNYLFLEQLAEKVTISEESIKLRTLFKRKSILINEVKGYQLKNENIYLAPIDEELKGIYFSANLVGDGKIIDYFVSDKIEVKPIERNRWNN